MEGFEYETAIKDGMSGPARGEVDALKALQAEIRSTEKAIRGLQQEQLNYKRAGFKGGAQEVALDIAKLRVPLAGMKAELRDLKNEEKGGFLAGLRESLIPEIALGELAAEGIKKVGEIATEGVKFVIEMGEFRENAELAYEAVLGTKEQAERVFEGFEAIGRNAHLPVERAQGLAQDLLLQGERNIDTIDLVLTGIADLNRVGLEKGAAAFQSIVERSLTTGAFTLPRRVSGLGIQLPDLYATLAKRLHTSVDDVKKEIKQGKVSAEVGISALAEAITGGKVGELASRRLTFGDIATDITNNIKSIFEGTDVDFSKFSRAVGGVRDLFEALDGTTTDFKSNASGMFGTILDLGAEAVDAVVDFGLATETTFLTAELEAKKLGVGIRDVIETLKELSAYAIVVRPQVQAAERLDSNKTEEQQVTEATLKTPDPRSFWDALVDAFRHPFTDPADLARTAAERTGKAHVDGLVKSLQDGKPRVEVAASELVSAIDDAGRKEMDAHSPSRKAMRLGDDWIDGLVLSLEDGRRRTDDAVGMSVPALDGAQIPDFSGAGGGGGGGVTVHPGAIQVAVHAPSGTSATREELQELIEQASDDMLERLVIELGG